jgi:polyhydroxyalkanoate synthase subunit PhaC
MSTSAPIPAEPHADALDLPLKTALAAWAHGISPASVAGAQADWLTHLAVSPSKQVQLASSAWRKSLQWLAFATCASGGAGVPCAGPSSGDKRFADPAWQLPPYAALAQVFLLADQWWAEATHGVRGVSRHHEDVAAFTVRQLLDTLSPSNSPWLNPQVLRETARTGGSNLVQGAANWAHDAMALATGRRPRGVEAFRPGETVAITPGEVVFRNHLIELIQYAPSTPRVHKEPVLLVPSWIMKFYILDLTPADSLVKHLVQEGHTVFMVSWHNPGPDDSDVRMDDYLREGVLAALEAVQKLVPRTRIHAAGYCLGGTLLAMAAAWLAQQEREPLRSVSLLAAQVDFEQPGELGLFIDESQIAFLEDLMARHGYLDGREMAGAFQLINSKDLVWSKLVHEYLMGAHTPMTPLRAWNADATRLPARMHSEYLRSLYLHNDFAEGRYRVLGEPVVLDALRTPLFVVATERDHVSPWPSVWKVLRLAPHAPSTFVLTSGGHNVGIVSPPAGPGAHPQAGYRIEHYAPGKAPADPAGFLVTSEHRPGSWWPAWTQWLAGRSSGTVPARRVRSFEAGGAPVRAPGEYVHQQ